MFYVFIILILPVASWAYVSDFFFFYAFYTDEQNFFMWLIWFDQWYIIYRIDKRSIKFWTFVVCGLDCEHSNPVFPQHTESDS